MRFKLSQNYGLCFACFQPRLSTDGNRVVCCGCGHVTLVSDWNERVQAFARKVRGRRDAR